MNERTTVTRLERQAGILVYFPNGDFIFVFSHADMPVAGGGRLVRDTGYLSMKTTRSVALTSCQLKLAERHLMPGNGETTEIALKRIERFAEESTSVEEFIFAACQNNMQPARR